MMRPIMMAALLGAATLSARAQELSELTLPPNGDNQKAEVSQWIGPVQITITYHSPRVHLRGSEDRTGRIYGGVVQYGFFDDGFGPSHATPWRVGANETTEISFSDDVKFEGHDVKAGRYALFLELEKSGPWTWILSTGSAGVGISTIRNSMSSARRSRRKTRRSPSS
jgi:hypothetical protein